MDILSTHDMEPLDIQRAILLNEQRHPGINQEFNRLMEDDPIFPSFIDWFGADKTNAALISDCRSDPLNCGRCAINAAWSKFKEGM